MKRPLRILYVAGPGDLIGTFRHWKEGRADPSQVSWTYSGQFFDVCKRHGAQAVVIAAHGRKDSLIDEQFEIYHEAPRSAGLGGVAYHLAELARCLRLVLRGIRCRADIIIIDMCDHWFTWACANMLGIKVVPSLHCTLWPSGYLPTGRVARVIHWLNGWFWRKKAFATIAVSPACERQVRSLAGRVSGPIYQVRATYDRETFSKVDAPSSDRSPFRILFAGRIEANKGVFDLLNAAELLEKRHPGAFCWEYCGTGSSLTELQAEISSRGLNSLVSTRGKLDRSAMIAAYGRCYVVAAPTKSDFCEGMNQVAIETVLAGRPIISSSVVPANEVLGDAVVEVPANDVRSLAHSVEQLFLDDELYSRKCKATQSVREQFYDPKFSWGAGLNRIVDRVCAEFHGNCEVSPVSEVQQAT